MTKLNPPHQDFDRLDKASAECELESLRGGELSPKASTDTLLRLYIAEEQQILREAYGAFFLSHPTIDVVGTSGDTGIEALMEATTTLKPSVMLLGFKVLHTSTIERLHQIRDSDPGLPILLLSTSYEAASINVLRDYCLGSESGCAYILKHTIDTVEQLTQVVQSVAEGRIILDPVMIEGLITSSDAHSTLLKDLSPRELEVLSWMAKSYNNNAIAKVLCLELKTIERHINGIYNKLGTTSNAKDARVHAVTTYLRATGWLGTTLDQVTQVMQSAFGGRINLDPVMIEGLITSSDAHSTLLTDLSPRELEVLSWMARGYNNHTIADVLRLDPKTIERHISGIYNKLGAAPDAKHARVRAVTTYLLGTGSLLLEEFVEA